MIPLSRATTDDLPALDLTASALSIIEHLQAADVQAVASWAENGLVILAIVYCFLFPTIALILGALTHLGLRASRRLPGFLRVGNFFDVGDTPVPTDPNGLKSYLKSVQAGLPRFLTLLLIVGLVPFLGLILGLIYYRHSPVAALRNVLHSTDLGLLRWILPLATVGLVIAQPLPVFGPLCIPLLCVAHHGTYEAILRRRLVSTLAA